MPRTQASKSWRWVKCHFYNCRCRDTEVYSLFRGSIRMAEQTRLPRFGLRTLLVFLACISIAMAYLGTYYQLRQRGIAEAAEYEMDGFLYAPIEDVFASEDLSVHYKRMRIFAPANWIDRNFFGGPGPIRGIMFHISAETRHGPALMESLADRAFPFC